MHPVDLEMHQNFLRVFESPKELLPDWEINHTICTIPGSKPMNIMPRCYSPDQKDEVECVVKEMSGWSRTPRLMQLSHSPYARLVKKRDGS